MKKDIDVNLTDKQTEEVLVMARSRLTKWKFTILDFSHIQRTLKAERSNLEHVLLGLVRHINIKIRFKNPHGTPNGRSIDDPKKVLTYECKGKYKAMISSAIVGAILPIVLWGAEPYDISFDGIFAILLCAILGGAVNIIMGHIFARQFFKWVQEDIKKVQTSSTSQQ